MPASGMSVAGIFVSFGALGSALVRRA